MSNTHSPHEIGGFDLLRKISRPLLFSLMTLKTRFKPRFDDVSTNNTFHPNHLELFIQNLTYISHAGNLMLSSAA